VFVDGSVVEALMFELVAKDDPVYAGTLAAFSRLQTPFGGYQRLEPKLSLTGGSGADLYDASEWIMLDLRIGQAARRMGDTSSADTRLDWVTNSAALNDNLIPELFDRNDGGYAGAVPIVGYGAGAWLMTALEKHGAVPPGPHRSLAHCDGVEPDAGAAEPDAGHATQPGTVDAGEAPDADGGTSQAPQADAGVPGKADVKRASTCAAHLGTSSGATSGLVPVAVLLLLASAARTRRRNWRESR
ncbi:MAG TPA: hypothetical protein VHM19_20625, partial [Polyangiales bacterium]|nr:hypothetical protein [Polyangiales bacterium]